MLGTSRNRHVLAAALFTALLAPWQNLSTTRTVEVALTEGTSIAAAASPDHRWIAIDLLGALWILPMDGGETRQLTPELLEARLPTWSADSRSIAFQGYGDDGVWHIYVIPRQGGDVKPLTSGEFDDREPAWSHDGTRIAFSSDRADGIYTIWEIAVTSGAVRRLTSREGWMPAWTAEDRELTFISRDESGGPGPPSRETHAGLWTIDTDGRERLLVPSVAGALPDAAAWSPNGVDLAYTMRGHLFFNGRAVTRDDVDVFPFRPQWISRTELIYTANGHINRLSPVTGTTGVVPFTARVPLRRATFTIQHRDLESADSQRLKGIVSPVVSPDGRAVAFVAMGDLWVAPVGGKPVQVTNDAAVEMDPAWSPDGTELAFSSDRSGEMALWVHDLRTHDERRLDERGGISHPAWSPDGNHIAFLVNRRRLETINIRRDQHTLTVDARTPAGELGPPTWSADNRTVAVSTLFPYSNRYRQGLNQLLLYALDPSGRFSSVVFPGHSAGNRGRNSPVWSPDGFRMAFVTEGTLWTVPVDERGGATGPPRPIASDQPDSPGWERDSAHIVYQTPAGLRRVASEGGIPEPIPLDLLWHSASTPERVVVHVGRVFDGVIEGLRLESDIVIERGIIREISGHREDLHTGAVVNAAEETVIPGLMDMHARFDPDYGARFGRLWLAYGVTSVRVAGIDPYVGLEQAEAFDAGRRPGPRLFVGGDSFDGLRVSQSATVSITGEEQLGRELDRASAVGVDFLGTSARLPNRFQMRVIDFAHSMGKPAASGELHPAIANGIDVVEQLRGSDRRGYATKTSAMGRSYRDVVDLIASSGVTLIPAIAAEGGFAAREAGDRALLFDPRLALFPRAVVAALTDLVATASSPALDAAVRSLELTLKAIVAAGGRIVAGSDSPAVPYGLGLHAELESYVHAGMTPFQALQTATIGAAQALGLDAELGTIEPGKRADLTFIGGDPLQDIRATRDVKRVMRGGRVFVVGDLVTGR